MNDILNDELKIKDVPVNNNMEGANKFAHTVSCYLKSFDETAKISKYVKSKIREENTKELSLTEIRLSLFFYFRAIRHGGREPNSKIVNSHLDLIRNRIKK